ncbi:MAG: alpha amylase C-terminal domain-containing protein, partial [Burkholderiales bacterium]|nr:alpha amylase C-terminal domain-containing protein [Burkholderiales bacterium]
WNHDRSLDWHLLDEPHASNLHRGMHNLLRDLNALYRATPALYQRDFVPEGFEWIDHGDAERSVLSFVRRGADPNALVVVACNFTPTPHRGHRLGVPNAGTYRECLNTDSAHYGGSNVGTPLGAATAEAVACHGRAQSIVVDLPPLATVMFEWNA